ILLKEGSKHTRPALTSPTPPPPRTFSGMPGTFAQSGETRHPRANSPATDPIATLGGRNNFLPLPAARRRRQSLFRRKPLVTCPRDTSPRDSAWLIIHFLPAPPDGEYSPEAACPGKPPPDPASTWDCSSSEAPLAELPSSCPRA